MIPSPPPQHRKGMGITRDEIRRVGYVLGLWLLAVLIVFACSVK